MDGYKDSIKKDLGITKVILILRMMIDSPPFNQLQDEEHALAYG
jgi:hypothetical protein